MAAERSRIQLADGRSALDPSIDSWPGLGDSMSDQLRFGILGAARIAPKALIEPAQPIDSVVVTRVAARDQSRAEAFAAEHGIGGVSSDYAALIAADDVDVVYNPLPMSLHAEWTIAALRAGKHVLCEKSLAANAAEAEEMVRVAAETGQILGEAVHYRYHPLFDRVLALMAAGVIGDLERVAAIFSIEIGQPDIRWDYDTAGGSLMDLGCYSVQWARTIAGEEPTVTSAGAEVGPPDVDAAIWAELAFPSGATGRIESSMVQPDEEISLTITGTKGEIVVDNPLAPQNGNLVTVRTEGGETSGPIDAGVTYDHMLRAFVDHVVHGSPFITMGDDSINNMVAMDAIYTAAGLSLRGRD